MRVEKPKLAFGRVGLVWFGAERAGWGLGGISVYFTC